MPLNPKDWSEIEDYVDERLAAFHKPQKPNKWLSVPDARKVARCRLKAIYDALDSGELPSKIYKQTANGPVRSIFRDDLTTWMENRKSAQHA